MGSPVSQVAQPMNQQPQGGKGVSPSSSGQFSGKSSFANTSPPTAETSGIQPNRVTYPGQGGQPQMGQPNNYSNTIGGWDNATIGTQQYQQPTTAPQKSQSGKFGSRAFGKGA